VTIIKFPGSETTETDTGDTVNTFEYIKNDIQKLEEHCEENQEDIEGVVLISFSPGECTHWITPGLSVQSVYFMLSQIQNALIQYADGGGMDGAS